MAVYERTYRSYSGPETAERWRFLVLPRYAFGEALSSKLFAGFLILCWLWVLAVAVLIYLPHNLGIIEAFQLKPENVSSFFQDYGPDFFYPWFVRSYGVISSFVVAFVLGPALISADLRNNGLPLYLARPFSRPEYLLGKATVLIAMISAVTWVPASLLYLLQASLGGRDWLADHWSLGPRMVLCFLVWIVVLTLLSLSVSAYVRWKPAARVALMAIFLIGPPMAALVNFHMGTYWGSIIDIPTVIGTIWAGLLGVDAPADLPVWAACLVLVVACGASVVLLDRKVRAYEVVR